MLLFTKRQIHGANLARNFQAGLAFPSNADMKWAIHSNLIKDCPVTVKDMGMGIKVWGPSIAMLKGKTVRMMPPVVRQDAIEIPKEIWELHKDVTLTIDIFCQQDTILHHLQSDHMLSVNDALEQEEGSHHLQCIEKYVRLLLSARF